MLLSVFLLNGCVSRIAIGLGEPHRARGDRAGGNRPVQALGRQERVSGIGYLAGGVGSWSGADNANDPVAELDAQIEALATDTGRMPNRLVIGLPAWAISLAQRFKETKARRIVGVGNDLPVELLTMGVSAIGGFLMKQQVEGRKERHAEQLRAIEGAHLPSA
jgi:hypothetical protein